MQLFQSHSENNLTKPSKLLIIGVSLILLLVISIVSVAVIVPNTINNNQRLSELINDMEDKIYSYDSGSYTYYDADEVTENEMERARELTKNIFINKELKKEASELCSRIEFYQGMSKVEAYFYDMKYKTAYYTLLNVKTSSTYVDKNWCSDLNNQIQSRMKEMLNYERVEKEMKKTIEEMLKEGELDVIPNNFREVSDINNRFQHMAICGKINVTSYESDYATYGYDIMVETEDGQIANYYSQAGYDDEYYKTMIEESPVYGMIIFNGAGGGWRISYFHDEFVLLKEDFKDYTWDWWTEYQPQWQEPEPKKASENKNSSSETYYVNAFSNSGIYVRVGASKNTSSILYIEEGDTDTKLKYIESVDGGDGYTWYRVELPNKTIGYVRSDVVEKW